MKTLVYFTDGQAGHFLSDGYVPEGVYQTPAIDQGAFPNTPLESFWTATPHWGDHAFAEAIDFFIGTLGYVARNKKLQVRMVRGVMK